MDGEGLLVCNDVNVGEVAGVRTGIFDVSGVPVPSTGDELGLDEAGVGVRVGLADEVIGSEELMGLFEALGVMVGDADGL